MTKATKRRKSYLDACLNEIGKLGQWDIVADMG